VSDAMSTSRTSARPRKCAFLPEQGNPKCQPLERHPWCDGGFDDGRCALGPHTVSSMTIDSSGEEPLANVKAGRCLELLKCLLEFGPAGAWHRLKQIFHVTACRLRTYLPYREVESRSTLPDCSAPRTHSTRNTSRGTLCATRSAPERQWQRRVPHAQAALARGRRRTAESQKSRRRTPPLRASAAAPGT
jgi:hypothetical protein